MCICVCVYVYVCVRYPEVFRKFLWMCYTGCGRITCTCEVISYEKIRRKHRIKDSSYVSFSRDFLNLEICELSLNNHRLDTSKWSNRRFVRLKVRFQGNRVRRCLVRNWPNTINFQIYFSFSEIKRLVDKLYSIFSTYFRTWNNVLSIIYFCSIRN